MAKGAALEAIPLPRNCLPSIAENHAVAIRDMNAFLLKKQQDLLARAEAAPLPQPNVRESPSSREREMTGYEAALQEADSLRTVTFKSDMSLSQLISLSGQ
jgi:hypothetical protein